MNQSFVQEYPKWMLQILNNTYEIEKKIRLHGDNGNSQRNLEKIKEAFAEVGLFFEDPIGQSFKETRTDLEATIAGTSTENLVVVEVIKPVIRRGDSTFSKVIQKGIVIVEGKEGGNV